MKNNSTCIGSPANPVWFGQQKIVEGQFVPGLALENESIKKPGTITSEMHPPTAAPRLIPATADFFHA